MCKRYNSEMIITAKQHNAVYSVKVQQSNINRDSTHNF